MTNRHQTSHNSALTEENQTSWHTSNLQPMFCSHTEWQTSKHCIHHRSLYSETGYATWHVCWCLL